MVELQKSHLSLCKIKSPYFKNVNQGESTRVGDEPIQLGLVGEVSELCDTGSAQENLFRLQYKLSNTSSLSYLLALNLT